MTILAENSPVMDKTKELCAAIAGDPEYQSLLGKVERFMGDDAAKLQFQSVQERSHELGKKQQSGLELSVGEVEEIEAARARLDAVSPDGPTLSAYERVEGVANNDQVFRGASAPDEVL